jgi:ribosomal protein S18 acetylase RimI-like enzyme
VTVLTVDHVAFPPFWQLDEHGLREALDATPWTRFRLARADGRIVGYAICGRSAERGFVQRLAVDPDVQRGGIGWDLMVDGLRWMHRRGVKRAVVNTQLGNQPALDLYERLGFRRQPVGLSVLVSGLPR